MASKTPSGRKATSHDALLAEQVRQLAMIGDGVLVAMIGDHKVDAAVRRLAHRAHGHQAPEFDGAPGRDTGGARLGGRIEEGDRSSLGRRRARPRPRSGSARPRPRRPAGGGPSGFGRRGSSAARPGRLICVTFYNKNGEGSGRPVIMAPSVAFDLDDAGVRMTSNSACALARAACGVWPVAQDRAGAREINWPQPVGLSGWVSSWLAS